MITILDERAPESVLRKTRVMQEIAVITIAASIVSYRILLTIVNIFAPETMYINFMGDRGDPISMYVGAYGPYAVALSILVLGLANRINYHCSNPEVSRIKSVVITFSISALWVILSQASILITTFIFFFMRFGRV